jgi:hypothetical protein
MITTKEKETTKEMILAVVSRGEKSIYLQLKTMFSYEFDPKELLETMLINGFNIYISAKTKSEIDFNVLKDQLNLETLDFYCFNQRTVMSILNADLVQYNRLKNQYENLIFTDFRKYGFIPAQQNFKSAELN